MISIEWYNDERNILLCRERANILVHGLDGRYRGEWLDCDLSHPALLILNEHIVEAIHLRWVDEAFPILVRNEVGAGSAHKLCQVERVDAQRHLLHRRRSLQKVDDGGDGFLVPHGQQ